MLTVAAFDDYPELLANGSAISLIAGVSYLDHLALPANRVGRRTSIRPSRLRLDFLRLDSVPGWLTRPPNPMASNGRFRYSACHSGSLAAR